MLEFKYIEHGLLKSNQHGYTHRWEILINIYQSSIKTIGCLYIYLSRFVIAIHSTLGRRNANFGQELMSSSVFIWQVSIDHTFGSHRITHLAKLQEIAEVVPVYEKTY